MAARSLIDKTNLLCGRPLFPLAILILGKIQEMKEAFFSRRVAASGPSACGEGNPHHREQVIFSLAVLMPGEELGKGVLKIIALHHNYPLSIKRL